MRPALALPVMFALAAGCAPAMHLTYPGVGVLDRDVELLGPVTVCRGGGCCSTEDGCQWPLSLTNPPEAYTYQAALRDRVVKKYGVPASDVVLGDISVETENELVGTVRSWKATAQAGRRRSASAGASSREDRLRELEGLFARGVISR